MRLAKVTANPFNDEGDMKLYHHPACMFQTFQKVRATTQVIEVNFLVSFKQLKEIAALRSSCWAFFCLCYSNFDVLQLFLKRLRLMTKPEPKGFQKAGAGTDQKTDPATLD